MVRSGRTRCCVCAVVYLLAATGCRFSQADSDDEVYIAPATVLQHQAYPEAVTGRFASLADFETSAVSGKPGYGQVGHFRIAGSGRGERKYVVNITRTGIGAMEATIPPGATLEFTLPAVHDFDGYTLLLAAVHSRKIRDDLKVTLVTDSARWSARPVLLEKGWNNVLVDLQRLKAMEGFEPRGVRKIRFAFAAAEEPVTINLDDVLLIDNRREIKPLPTGMKLTKAGLDYTLTAPGRAQPIQVYQGHDGLWRLGGEQAVLELATGGSIRPSGGAATEDIAAFGGRRVGKVEIAEANAVRLRIVNTWYFPTSAGQWETLAIRQVRWQHTLYGDGRHVTDVVVNNAGGRELSAVRITAPREAAWSGGRVARQIDLRAMGGSVGRWSYLLSPKGTKKEAYESNYLKPGRMDVRIGEQEASDGDVGADGFDESQGCYHLQARAGRCRFQLMGGVDGIVDPVFRVRGRWASKVSAGCEGQALRTLATLADGTVVFVLPGVVKGAHWIEVTGKPALVGE